MDGAGVQEAVERIPLKRDGLWRILIPLVKERRWNAASNATRKMAMTAKLRSFVGIAAPQGLADMELSKESLNLGRSSFTGVMMMWYNIHSISSPVLLWIFRHFHYTKWR